MKSIYSKIVLLILAISCFSCTKEISVDVAHEPQTVIFGELTNLNQPTKITIVQTVPLNSSETSQAVNDASISLFQKNQSGETSLVTSDFNVNQGVYTSLESIAGIPGNSYWIEVILDNGTVFKSKEEVMLPVVPIIQVATNAQFNDILDVSFMDPNNTTNFYKLLVRTFNDNVLLSTNFTQSNDVLFNGNEQAKIEADIFPSGNEDEDIPEFDRIEVQLSNINFESYQFLLNQSAQIETNTEANDSESGDPSQLFSTPPVNVLGNIINTSNNTISLGNFSVGAIHIITQEN